MRFLACIMAVVIGVVVSIPITLQIFEREIVNQVHLDNVAAAAANSDDVEHGPVAQRLKAVQEEIAENEAILRGDVQGLTSPELQAAQTEFDEAQTASEAADAAKTDAYKVMICEKEGAGSNPDCNGLASQTSGEGPLYQARVREYQDALTKADVAAARLATARTAIESARTNCNILQHGDRGRSAAGGAEPALWTLGTRGRGDDLRRADGARSGVSWGSASRSCATSSTVGERPGSKDLRREHRNARPPTGAA